MQKPESRFSKLLNSKLDKDVYFEKMSNPYKGGIPDFYYEGTSNILWSEHKWIEKPWDKDREASKVCTTASWIKQRHWLERAFNNDRQVCTIIGVGKGKDTKGYILHYPFNFVFETNLLLSLEEITGYIQKKVL